jgi:hypothetical protein
MRLFAPLLLAALSLMCLAESRFHIHSRRGGSAGIPAHPASPFSLSRTPSGGVDAGNDNNDAGNDNSGGVDAGNDNSPVDARNDNSVGVDARNDDSSPVYAGTDDNDNSVGVDAGTDNSNDDNSNDNSNDDNSNDDNSPVYAPLARGPAFTLCPLCVDFIGETLPRLLAALGDAGALATCGEACKLLGNRTEVAVCDVLCSAVGIEVSVYENRVKLVTFSSRRWMCLFFLVAGRMCLLLALVVCVGTGQRSPSAMCSARLSASRRVCAKTAL